MYTLKSITLTITFYLIAIPLLSHVSNDSLNLVIEKAKGERKLDLLFQLANTHLESDDLFVIAGRIEKEALRQKNMSYLATSYMLKSAFYLNSNNIDSTVYYAQRSNQTYEKYNIKNPNETYRILGYLYLYNGYYDLAIYNIQHYLKEGKYSYKSYILLAEAYAATKKYALAKEAILQAIEQFDVEKEEAFSHTELYMYQILAEIDLYSGAYQKALENCSILEKKLKRDQTKLEETVVYLYTFDINNLYASIYIKLEDVKNAKIHLDKAQQIPENEHSEQLNNMLNSTLGEYYLLIKDYNKALVHIDTALNYFNKVQLNQGLLLELTELKIETLQLLRKSDDALELQQKLFNYKDSIYSVNIPLQLSQLSKTYELERIRLEREKDKADLEKSWVINIGLIVVSILLFLILFLFRYKNQKLRNKNKVLFKQYEESSKYLNRVNNNLIKEENNDQNEANRDSLFTIIELYMKDKEVFKDPSLNREKMAKELNTNWLYISNAIKEETGKGFLDYVNHYRLNYARKRLLADGHNSVGDILIESGFASNSTFHRLFKEKFGMTPNELRQTSTELNAEKSIDTEI